jgi:hypothetical protein
MKNYLTRLRVVIGGVVVIGACVAAAVLPSAASANAYGCTTSGAGLPWYGLNTAYTCIWVQGPTENAGDNVASVQGSWSGVAGTICNYRWAVRFSDINGRVYETDWSGAHAGCTFAVPGTAETFRYSGSSVRKRTGEVCVYLYESGSQRPGVPCETIHP